ncbi:hypothetical protein BsWGS_21128 [Bradybaena similaris]
MDTPTIVATAKQMGLEGQALVDWVNDQENKARDQRAERRKHETEAAENQRKHELALIEANEKIRQQLEADKAKQRLADEKQFQILETAKQKEEERRQKEEERRQAEREFELQRLDKENKRLELQTAMAADREKYAKQEEEEKKTQRDFEASEKEKDRLAQVEIQRLKNQSMLEAKQLEIDFKVELDQQRRQDQKDVPKHKRYQHVIRNFTKEDDFPAWLKNMERCLREDEVPDGDWAYILKKSLSGEPQRLIENVSERYISSYEYLKDKLLHHFKCDSEGYRVRFKNLSPKSNQTFFDYLTEVEALLDNWLDAEAVDKSFEKFHQMIVKDKIVSSIPAQMSRFLKEQRITTIQDLEEKGTAYFNANRDVFALNTQPDFDVGAVTD